MAAIFAAELADVDLAIVGGGMVGASLALALGQTALRVALIEPVDPGAGGGQPSFDDRTSALSNGTRRILETIGAWPAMAPHAAAIRQIHVSEAGRFGTVQLDAAEQGLPALGYTLSNRHIGAALWSALRDSPRVQLRAPAKVAAVAFGGDHARLQLVDGGTLTARLVVAADGAQSLVRQSAGIHVETTDYDQVAIVASVQTAEAAAGIAYERFTPQGPIALLPLRDGHYTVVWTVSSSEAQSVQALDESEFRRSLQQRFGWRAGAFRRVGARNAYLLSLSRATRCIAPRLAVVGNAAQTLHPVAGQGFNLGLRDAAVLAELVAATPADVGNAALLEEYQRRRNVDRAGMIRFTDGLVQLFAHERPGAGELRSLGMTLFNGLPVLKRALSRVSWGFGERAPRLLRGLPLR